MTTDELKLSRDGWLWYGTRLLASPVAMLVWMYEWFDYWRCVHWRPALDWWRNRLP